MALRLKEINLKINAKEEKENEKKISTKFVIKKKKYIFKDMQEEKFN